MSFAGQMPDENDRQDEMTGKVRYFLGVDVGGTKTQALITAQDGRVLGWGLSGPGNHEQVGYEGLQHALQEAASRALAAAGIERNQISGAGFGVAGYDWPSEREPTLQAIRALGLDCPLEVVNDTLLGLLAGASQGWGVSVVAGTGCNCWGWDATRTRVGQVTGRSLWLGEAAGSSELVVKAMQAVAYEWARRGPRTRLSQAFISYTGAKNLGDLLEGYCEGYYPVDATAAPLVFDVAAAGDPVAVSVIEWAGRELGELANAVIRQLEFENLAFEVVLMGGMFGGSPQLSLTMQATIQALAPGARLVRLETAPVAGAVLLGMEAAGEPISAPLRQAVCKSGAETG
jgi:N-acetylglucosamine kinase-like BadF-type ATPase